MTWLAIAAAALLACGEANDETVQEEGQGGAAGSATATTAGPGGTSAVGGSGASSPACFDHGTFEPMSGVTFEGDVAPIFAASCNAGSCHGSLTSPDGGLYLGKASDNDPATLDAVHDNLVDVAAHKAPGMKRVHPGDSAQSFLMVKLDDDLGCAQVVCGTQGCGSKMPYGATKPLLAEEPRAIIRSWILDGAPR
jgi:hypothetical protein